MNDGNKRAVPKKGSVKTHTGTIITKDGEKTVQLRETPTTWCVGRNETYRKEDGRRCGSPFARRRLVLSSIKPILQCDGEKAAIKDTKNEQ